VNENGPSLHLLALTSPSALAPSLIRAHPPSLPPFPPTTLHRQPSYHHRHSTHHCQYKARQYKESAGHILLGTFCSGQERNQPKVKMSSGFFRGTTADQDARFGNAEKRLMKKMKFASVRTAKERERSEEGRGARACLVNVRWLASSPTMGHASNSPLPLSPSLPPSLPPSLSEKVDPPQGEHGRDQALDH